MKVSYVALALTALSGALAAIKDTAEKAVNGAESVGNMANEENVAPTNADDVILSNVDLSYILEDMPKAKPQEFTEFLTSKPLSIYYTLVNKEESDLTVVGVGGSFRNPMTGEVSANITVNSIGPIVIKPGEKEVFRQKVDLNLDLGNYVLIPSVYVAFQVSLKVIEAKSLLVAVVEEALSFLNPQLLFVEFVLLFAAAAAVRFFYPNFLETYFKGTAPVKVRGSPKSSGHDAEWAPKTNHQSAQPKKTKAKARRAY